MRELKFPIYPNINDLPRLPTAEQAGNASDAIARFNQAIDVLDPLLPIVDLPLNGNLINFASGNRASFHLELEERKHLFDFVPTEFGVSLKITNEQYSWMENQVYDFTPIVLGNEFSFSAWFEGNLVARNEYYFSSTNASEVYSSLYIKGDLSVKDDGVGNTTLKFSSSSYNYRYRSSTSSLSSISSSSSSSSFDSVVVPSSSGFNHVAVTRKYEGTDAITSFFFNGEKVHQWTTTTSVLVLLTQAGSGLRLGMGQGIQEGKFSQVTFFDRALEDKEIKGLFFKPKFTPVYLERELTWEPGYTLYVYSQAVQGDGTLQNPYPSMADALRHLKRKKIVNVVIKCRDRFRDENLSLEGLMAANQNPYLGYNKDKIEIQPYDEERFQWNGYACQFAGPSDPNLEVYISDCDFVSYAPIGLLNLDSGFIYNNCNFYAASFNNTSHFNLENSSYLRFQSNNHFYNLVFSNNNPGSLVRAIEINHNKGMVVVDSGGAVFHDFATAIELYWGSKLKMDLLLSAFDNCDNIAFIDESCNLHLSNLEVLIPDRLTNSGGDYWYQERKLKWSKLTYHFPNLDAGSRNLILETQGILYLKNMKHNASGLSLSKQIADESSAAIALPGTSVTVGGITTQSFDNNLSQPVHLIESGYRLILSVASVVSNPVDLEIYYLGTE